MNLRERLEADVSEFFTRGGLARSAVYRSAGGGVAVTIPLFIHWGEYLGEEGGVRAAEATVTVRVSDVPEPRIYDEVEVDGKTWTVVSVISGNGLIWRLAAVRDVRVKG